MNVLCSLLWIATSLNLLLFSISSRVVSLYKCSKIPVAISFLLPRLRSGRDGDGQGRTVVPDRTEPSGSPQRLGGCSSFPRPPDPGICFSLPSLGYCSGYAHRCTSPHRCASPHPHRGMHPSRFKRQMVYFH